MHNGPMMNRPPMPGFGPPGPVPMGSHMGMPMGSMGGPPMGGVMSPGMTNNPNLTVLVPFSLTIIKANLHI